MSAEAASWLLIIAMSLYLVTYGIAVLIVRSIAVYDSQIRGVHLVFFLIACVLAVFMTWYVISTYEEPRSFGALVLLVPLFLITTIVVIMNFGGVFAQAHRRRERP